jgi:hypothetical protein
MSVTYVNQQYPVPTRSEIIARLDIILSDITVQVPKELHERVNSLDVALQAPIAISPRRYFQPRRRIQNGSIQRGI